MALLVNRAALSYQISHLSISLCRTPFHLARVLTNKVMFQPPSLISIDLTMEAGADGHGHLADIRGSSRWRALLVGCRHAGEQRPEATVVVVRDQIF